jgi:hypothetical protein
MAHEYVFRGESMPFAPDPNEEQARERAKREAEKLVAQEPVNTHEQLANIHEVERRLDDYQVGGLDAFGTAAESPEWDAASQGNQQPDTPSSHDHASSSSPQ